MASSVEVGITTFDFPKMLEVVDVVEQRDALPSLYARAQHLLESAPQNQSALVLAGEAAAWRGLRA